MVRAGARAISVDQADGGCQLRLHAGRHGPSEGARRVLPDDDRAAAGARRHHRPRRVAGRAPDADLPGRMHPFGAPRRAGDPAERLRDHQHQAGPRGRLSGSPAHP